MMIDTKGFLSIEQVQGQYLKPQVQEPKKTAEGKSFQEILQSKELTKEEVKFSKHAKARLNDRNIELTDAQLERLREGAVKASEKGIKESLVLVDQLAFIVNIPNNTVVTAMHKDEQADNIFTNIDGAVII